MDLNVFADLLTHSSSKRADWSARCHSIGIVISALAIALFAVQVISEGLSGWLSGAGSVVVGFGLWLSRRAERVNWDARFVRRRALLSDALGYVDAVSEGIDLITESVVTGQVQSVPKSERSGYYSSTATQGNGRLRENLLESIVWTEKLYRAAKSRLWLKAVWTAATAGGLATAIILSSAGALDARAAIQLASVVLVFVVSADQFDSAGKWDWASAEARRLRQVLSAARPVDLSEQGTVRLWAAFSDYAVLTAIAPAIPRGLYEHHRADLDALAASVLGSKGTASR